MRYLHDNMFSLFVWTIVAEALYFISFGLEYIAFALVKTIDNIMKIRYAIDFIQLGIVIWGIIVVGMIKDVHSEVEESMDVVEKR